MVEKNPASLDSRFSDFKLKHVFFQDVDGAKISSELAEQQQQQAIVTFEVPSRRKKKLKNVPPKRMPMEEI